MWRREYRDEDILFCCREEENKGDAIALAGCGGESTESKTYLLYVVEKMRTKVTTWLLQLVAERVGYRVKGLPLVCSGEEENKGDDMAIAGCGGESTESKTYLLYVVEKKRKR